MSSASENPGSRTIIWCVPRSVSSALTKCLSFIEHNEVWFEPYTYCNLARAALRQAKDAEIPMEYEDNEEVFRKAAEGLEAYYHTKFEPDRIAYGSVKRRLEQATSKHVFVKDMGFCIPKRRFGYLPRGYKHTFLIRNPLRTIHSYRNMAIFVELKSASLSGREVTWDNYDLERDDRYFTPGCFLEELYDMWRYVKENFDSDPVVIDADDLLSGPKETLSAYCAAVGLPYDDNLLQWDASDNIAKKIKAAGDNMLFDKDVYTTAMGSSEFMPPSELPPRDKLAPDVIRCSERVMKYYDEMYEHRIKVQIT